MADYGISVRATLRLQKQGLRLSLSAAPGAAASCAARPPPASLSPPAGRVQPPVVLLPRCALLSRPLPGYKKSQEVCPRLTRDTQRIVCCLLGERVKAEKKEA